MKPAELWDWVNTRRRIVVLIAITLFSLFGTYHVMHHTTHGLAVGADAASYLGMADNLRRGRGPTVPFTWVWDHYSVAKAAGFHNAVPSSHFPPGYPAVLALLSPATGGTRHAARLVNVASAGAGLFLIGLLTAKVTRYRSIVVALTPPALVLLMADTRPFVLEPPGWFESYQSVASEPICTVFFTAAVIAAGPAISRTGRRATYALVGTGILAAGAVATRWVGGAVVLAILIALLSDGHRELRDRIRRAAAFGAMAVAPIAAFAVYDMLLGGGSARVLGYHTKGNVVTESVKVLGRGIFPILWSDASRVALVLTFTAATVAAACWLPSREGPWRDDADGTALLRVALLTVPCYLAVIWLSLTFLDAGVAVGPRYYIPLRGVFIAALVAGVYRLLTTRLPSVAVSLALAIAVVLDVHAGWAESQFWWSTPSPWPVLAADRVLKDLPRDTLIVSTSPDYVYLQSGHPSLFLPSHLFYLRNRPNPTYDREVADMAQLLKRRGGYAFYRRTFDPVVTPEELNRLVPLEVVVSDENGTLYRVVTKSATAS